MIGRFDRETIECGHTMAAHSLARHWPVLLSRLEKAGLTVVDRPGPVARRTADDQPNSRVSGWPEAIGKGRPRVSRTSVAGSIPRAQNIVAAMSSGVTGSDAG